MRHDSRLFPNDRRPNSFEPSCRGNYGRIASKRFAQWEFPRWFAHLGRMSGSKYGAAPPPIPTDLTTPLPSTWWLHEPRRRGEVRAYLRSAPVPCAIREPPRKRTWAFDRPSTRDADRRSSFMPRRPTQRHCQPGCRADAARRREAARRSTVIDRLDPCDPGRFE